MREDTADRRARPCGARVTQRPPADSRYRSCSDVAASDVVAEAAVESPRSPDGGRVTAATSLPPVQATRIIARGSGEHLWDQVVGGQVGADFLYALTTMRVYCRPACPSPRRR